MKELETSLQQFGEFILKAQLVDEQGRTDPLAALDRLRSRIRTRHYSYRSECSYVDTPLGAALPRVRGGAAGCHPRVESASVRDFLTHLAVRRPVSSSRQNQALCALLFVCREVLGVNV